MSTYYLKAITRRHVQVLQLTLYTLVSKRCLGSWILSCPHVLSLLLTVLFNLLYSLALDKLHIHLKTKEKLQERKKRKYEAVQRKYLQAMQQRVDGVELSRKVIIQIFLDQRREVATEIDTRHLEDERRKAEEEIFKVSRQVL